MNSLTINNLIKRINHLIDKGAKRSGNNPHICWSANDIKKQVAVITNKATYHVVSGEDTHWITKNESTSPNPTMSLTIIEDFNTVALKNYLGYELRIDGNKETLYHNNIILCSFVTNGNTETVLTKSSAQKEEYINLKEEITDEVMGLFDEVSESITNIKKKLKEKNNHHA